MSGRIESYQGVATLKKAKLQLSNIRIAPRVAIMLYFGIVGAIFIALPAANTPINDPPVKTISNISQPPNSPILLSKTPILTPTPPTTPTSTPTPAIPAFKTELWNYSVECTFSDFKGVCKPGNYIMPDNEVIKYVSSFMYLENGSLYWRANNPFNTYGVFYPNYVSDQEQFNKDDYWVNPDYFFMHNMKGDCEDVSAAIASILENKGIRTKVIGGWLTINNRRVRDWMVEYKIGPVYYQYYGGITNLPFMTRGMFEFYKKSQGIDFEPIIMFDKSSYYEAYNSNW